MSHKMKVIFLRHAQTNFNIGKSNCKDESVNEYGKVTCRKLTGHYSTIISSSMKRCLETLEYSQISYDKLIISDLCREHKTDLCDFKQDEPYVIESESELLERVVKFRDYVKLIKPDLIISHADFIWHISSYNIKGERFGKWVENAEFVEFEV